MGKSRVRGYVLQQHGRNHLGKGRHVVLSPRVTALNGWREDKEQGAALPQLEPHKTEAVAGPSTPFFSCPPLSSGSAGLFLPAPTMRLVFQYKAEWSQEVTQLKNN